MNVSRRNTGLKIGSLGGLLLLGALVGTTAIGAQPADSSEGQPRRARMIIGDKEVWSGPATLAPASQGVAPWLFSPGVGEVLQMLQNKVDVPVIQAYIKGSQVPYNPSAVEVVALKQRGVPPELITAMVQRGGELRAQAEREAAAASAAAAYEEAAKSAAASASRPEDYAALYAGLYPGYNNWGWGGWPVVWPGFGFGFFGFPRFLDYDRFAGFGGIARFDRRFNTFTAFNNFAFRSFLPVTPDRQFVFGTSGPFSPVAIGQQPLTSSGVRPVSFSGAGSRGARGFGGFGGGFGGRGFGGGHR